VYVSLGFRKILREFCVIAPHDSQTEPKGSTMQSGLPPPTLPPGTRGALGKGDATRVGRPHLSTTIACCPYAPLVQPKSQQRQEGHRRREHLLGHLAFNVEEVGRKTSFTVWPPCKHGACFEYDCWPIAAASLRGELQCTSMICVRAAVAENRQST
jgi:hypothetical protein